MIRLLYPPCCRACGEPLDDDGPLRTCSNCVSAIDTIEDLVCDRCGHPLMSNDSIHGERCRNCPDEKPHYRAARAALAYGTPVRELIHAFKFRFHSGLGPLLATYLTAPYWRRFQGETDAIVPVPLHWFRLRWREFNQSEELARHLGEKVQVPVATDWLKRIRCTRTQSRLRTQSAKRRNVQNAFMVISPDSVAGKRILLLDDVFTTGHTVNECARVLMESGASEVSVLTLAKVLHTGYTGSGPIRRQEMSCS